MGRGPDTVHQSNPGMPIHIHIMGDCFHAPTQLSSCNTDHMVENTYNDYLQKSCADPSPKTMVGQTLSVTITEQMYEQTGGRRLRSHSIL